MMRENNLVRLTIFDSWCSLSVPQCAAANRKKVKLLMPVLALHNGRTKESYIFIKILLTSSSSNNIIILSKFTIIFQVFKPWFM